MMNFEPDTLSTFTCYHRSSYSENQLTNLYQNVPVTPSGSGYGSSSAIGYGYGAGVTVGVGVRRLCSWRLIFVAAAVSHAGGRGP